MKFARRTRILKTVGVIAEYNPFHEGHAYHLREIRKAFGEDTRIVAVMSGNFTQRGDLAIADKYTRAKAAVLGGCDLVIELPFPWSGENAEIFARAGVHILNAIGVVDVLSFGSECGDVSLLSRLADLLSDDDFRESVRQSDKHSSEGYPKLFYKKASEITEAAEAKALLTANNLLGIEYIRAIRKFNSDIVPHTVQRVGEAHASKKLLPMASSTAIRASLARGEIDQALDALPNEVRGVYKDACKDGIFPVFTDALSLPYLSYFCLNAPSAEASIADAGGGLYHRIFAMAKKAMTLEELIRLTQTKKYTAARIRRALRNTVLGVTSSDTPEDPSYTTVLAMNSRGQEILREIRKKKSFSILTKPADFPLLPEKAVKEAEAVNRADSLYTLAFPQIRSRGFFLRHSPFRKSANEGENFSMTTFVEDVDKTVFEE